MLQISIVTPTFNQGQYLERTVDSILSQNYPNLQYIIIDGGSTDQTVEIIKKYEKHLSYWISEKDRGQSHAINKGLSKCTGEVFNWVNSDDYLEPESLKNVAEQFSPEVGIVAGKMRKFGAGFNDVVLPDQNHLTDTSFWGINIVQPACFFRTSMIRELGGVNETLKYRMDLELIYRFILRFGIGTIKPINQLIAHALYHADSKTVKNTPYFFAEHNSILAHIQRAYELDPGLHAKFSSVQLVDYYKPTNWSGFISDVDKEQINDKLFEYLKQQLGDKSYCYRMAGHYLASQGAHSHSLTLFLTALFINPFKRANYGSAISALGNIIR